VLEQLFGWMSDLKMLETNQRKGRESGDLPW
jgi:hypothetical protein